jgi:integrase
MPRKGDALVLRGQSWYLCATIAGVRYQRRLGKSISRKIALELATIERGKILRGLAGIGTKRPKDISFDAASKEFQKWADANRKVGTAGHYADCLRQLAKVFTGKQLSAVSSFAVEGYKQARIQAGAKVAVNRELAVLRNLVNKCKQWQLYEGQNPVESVKMLKEPRQRLRFLEQEEEIKLLAVCEEPLRSLIILGVHTGLRIQAEALQLRWEDVDLKRGLLVVQAAYAKTVALDQFRLTPWSARR